MAIEIAEINEENFEDPNKTYFRYTFDTSNGATGSTAYRMVSVDNFGGDVWVQFRADAGMGMYDWFTPDAAERVGMALVIAARNARKQEENYDNA